MIERGMFLRLVPLCALLAAGCAIQPVPTGAPTPQQIAAVSADLAAGNLLPADYVAIGVTLSAKSCADLFTQEVLNSQQSRFGQSALAIGAGVAAAAGGPAGAGAAAGASALSALLGAAQSSLGAGPAPAAVYSLISHVEQAWLAAMPTPITRADAYALVENFAEQCNLPAIQAAMAQAMMTVPVTATTEPPVPVLLGEHPTAVPRHSARRSYVIDQPVEETAPSRLQREWEASGRPFTGRMPRVRIGG